MSSRDMTAALLAAIQENTVYPCLFYEGAFNASGSPDTQYLRLWSGIGTKTWNGYEWTGGGNLIRITPLEESTATKAIGFGVEVSGIPSANISLALQSIRQGFPGKIWLGLLDSLADELIADPYQLRNGRCDVSVIEDDGESCSILVQYEDRLIDLQRPRESRYTDADQQFRHTGDLGFEYVPSLQDKQLIWGGPGAASSPIATPSAPSGAGSAEWNFQNEGTYAPPPEVSAGRDDEWNFQNEGGGRAPRDNSDGD